MKYKKKKKISSNKRRFTFGQLDEIHVIDQISIQTT